MQLDMELTIIIIAREARATGGRGFFRLIWSIFRGCIGGVLGLAGEKKKVVMDKRLQGELAACWCTTAHPILRIVGGCKHFEHTTSVNQKATRERLR